MLLIGQFEGNAAENGQMRKKASSSRLCTRFPHFSFTPFEKGVKESVQWLRENWQIARGVERDCGKSGVPENGQ